MKVVEETVWGVAPARDIVWTVAPAADIVWG